MRGISEPEELEQNPDLNVHELDFGEININN